MLHAIRIVGLFFTGYILVACQSSPQAIEKPITLNSPSGQNLLPPRDIDSNKNPGTARQSPVPETLVLEEALALTLENNPELMVNFWALRAQDAAVAQAGLLLNPEIGFELENFSGSGSFRGTDQAETTVSLAQRLEIAGKRTKRKKVASLNRVLIEWDYESKRLALFTETAQRFIDVLGDQEKIALSQDLLALATQVAETVARRVDAGKVSPVESVKAHIALSSAKIALTRATRALDASKKALAAMWGSAHPEFKNVGGPIAPDVKIPGFEEITDRLSQNPEIARWDSVALQQNAVLEMEKALAVPDLTVSGGFKQINETDEHVFVAALTFELPVFNRNQGGIREAKAGVSKILVQKRAAELHLKTVLAQAYNRLLASQAEVESLKDELLPGAIKAFDAVNEGYRLGKFDLLDVLDAQRTLSQARLQFLEAQIDYHKALVDVEHLIVEKLDAGKASHEGEK